MGVKPHNPSKPVRILTSNESLRVGAADAERDAHATFDPWVQQTNGSADHCAAFRESGARRSRYRLRRRNPSIDVVATAGDDPVHGARPLERYMQRHVERRWGVKLVAGDIADGTVVTLDARESALVFGTKPLELHAAGSGVPTWAPDPSRTFPGRLAA